MPSPRSRRDHQIASAGRGARATGPRTGAKPLSGSRVRARRGRGAFVERDRPRRSTAPRRRARHTSGSPSGSRWSRGWFRQWRRSAAPCGTAPFAGYSSAGHRWNVGCSDVWKQTMSLGSDPASPPARAKRTEFRPTSANNPKGAFIYPSSPSMRPLLTLSVALRPAHLRNDCSIWILADNRRLRRAYRPALFPAPSPNAWPTARCHGGNGSARPNAGNRLPRPRCLLRKETQRRRTGSHWRRSPWRLRRPHSYRLRRSRRTSSMTAATIAATTGNIAAGSRLLRALQEEQRHHRHRRRRRGRSQFWAMRWAAARSARWRARAAARCSAATSTRSMTPPRTARTAARLPDAFPAGVRIPRPGRPGPSTAPGFRTIITAPE